MANYHPEKSVVSPEALAVFLQAPITGDLTEVPGIGPATAQKLKDNEISTTFALIGKYLMLKEEGVGAIEHAARFYFWICSLQLHGASRAGIVHSIGEKMAIQFPGIYDADEYPPYEEE